MTVPEPRSLGDGIHLIPAPLPFKSPEWVNIYAVDANGGLMLIDCGTDWEPGREAIRDGFRRLGLEETAVHTLLVSHLHPDHVGMSARLVRELGCRFVMHERAARLVDRYNDTPGYARWLAEIGQAHGVPAQVLAAVTPGDRPDYMPIIDPPDHLVSDGDQMPIGGGRSLEVVHTPGHDTSHICLLDTRTGVLFSGDHVLPRISPVIMYDADVGDPLGSYMGSLQRLVAMGIGLTYPAHGTLIDQGADRAHQILLHHDRRLRDMTDLVRSADTTAWNVMTQSFRPNLDPVSARLAFLETISHLEHLRLHGRVHGEERNGTTLYTA